MGNPVGIKVYTYNYSYSIMAYTIPYNTLFPSTFFGGYCSSVGLSLKNAPAKHALVEIKALVEFTVGLAQGHASHISVNALVNYKFYKISIIA